MDWKNIGEKASNLLKGVTDTYSDYSKAEQAKAEKAKAEAMKVAVPAAKNQSVAMTPKNMMIGVGAVVSLLAFALIVRG